MIPINASMQVAAGNLYCYTGGSKNPKQRRRTEKLIEATIGEMDQLGGKYQLLVGDFNADIEKLSSLKQLFDRGWVDLGAKAHIWGKVAEEYTCLTANSKKGTRRDFIMVSPELFPHIKEFQVRSTAMASPLIRL